MKCRLVITTDGGGIFIDTAFNNKKKYFDFMRSIDYEAHQVFEFTMNELNSMKKIDEAMWKGWD